MWPVVVCPLFAVHIGPSEREADKSASSKGAESNQGVEPTRWPAPLTHRVGRHKLFSNSGGAYV
jgi:hypothetical protein